MVVDSNKWHIPSESQRFGCRYSYEEAAYEPWAVSCRDGINVLVGHSRFDHSFGDYGRKQRFMGATSNFRDNASVAGVEVNLAADYVCEHLVPVYYYGSGCFVT